MKAIKKFINRSKEDKGTDLSAESGTKTKKGFNFRRKSNSGHSIENLGLGQTVPSTSFDDDVSVPKASKSSEPVPLSVCGYIIDLNKKLPESFTKLHKACWAGNEEKVVNLTTGSKSLDINSQDHELRTPLHLAAARGLDRIVKHLTKLSPDYSIKDSHGRTSLSKAVEGHNFGCVSTLLDAGADLNISDNDGNNALHWALLQNFSDIAISLLQHDVDCNAINKDGVTPLHLAANFKQLGVVRKLINEGAEVNAQDAANRTPIMMAAISGSIPVVSYLLENGADPNTKDKDSQTALQMAEEKGHIEVIALLREFLNNQEGNHEVSGNDDELTKEGTSGKSSETIETKATKQSDNDLDNISWNDSSSSNSPAPPKHNEIKAPTSSDINKNPALRKLSDFMADLGMSDISDEENSSNGSLTYEPEFDFTKKLSNIADNDKDTKMAVPDFKTEDSTDTKASYLSVQSKTKGDDDGNSSWSDSSRSFRDKKGVTQRLDNENTVDTKAEIINEQNLPQDIKTKESSDGNLGYLSVKFKNKSDEDGNSSWSDSSTSFHVKKDVSKPINPQLNHETKTSSGDSVNSPINNLANVIGMIEKLPTEPIGITNSSIDDKHPVAPPRSRKGSRSKSVSSNSSDNSPRKPNISTIGSPKNNSPQKLSPNQRKESISSFDSHSSLTFKNFQESRINESAISTEDKVIAKPDLKRDSILSERKSSVSSFDSESLISNKSKINEMLNIVKESTYESRPNESAISSEDKIDKPKFKRDSIISERKSSVSSFDTESAFSNESKVNEMLNIVNDATEGKEIKPIESEVSITSFDSDCAVPKPNETNSNEPTSESRLNDSAIITKPDIKTSECKVSITSFDSNCVVPNPNESNSKELTSESRYNDSAIKTSERKASISSFDSQYSLPKPNETNSKEPTSESRLNDKAIIGNASLIQDSIISGREPPISSFDSVSNVSLPYNELLKEKEQTLDKILKQNEVYSTTDKCKANSTAPLLMSSNHEDILKTDKLAPAASKDGYLLEDSDINTSKLQAQDLELVSKDEMKTNDFDSDGESVSSSCDLKIDVESTKDFGSRETLGDPASDGTLGRISTLQGADEIWFQNSSIELKNEPSTPSPDALDKNDNSDASRIEEIIVSNATSASKPLTDKIDSTSPTKLAPLKTTFTKISNGNKINAESGVISNSAGPMDSLIEAPKLEKYVKKDDLEKYQKSKLTSDISTVPEISRISSSEAENLKLNSSLDTLEKDTKIIETSQTLKITSDEDLIKSLAAHPQNQVRTVTKLKNNFQSSEKDTALASSMSQHKLMSDVPRKGLGSSLKPHIDDTRSLYKETIDENHIYNSYSESASSNGESSKSSKHFETKPIRPMLRRRHTVDNLNVNAKKNLDGEISSSSSDNLVTDKIDFFNTSSKRNSLVRNQFRFNRAKSVDFGEVGKRLNTSQTKRRVSTDFRIGSCEETLNSKVRKQSLTKSSTLSSLDESLPHSMDEDEDEDVSQYDESLQVSSNPNPVVGEGDPNLEDEFFSHLNIPVAKPTLYNVVVDLLRNRPSIPEDSESPKIRGDEAVFPKRPSLMDSDSSPTVSDSEDNDGNNGDEKTLHGSENEMSLSDDPLNNDVKMASMLFKSSTEVTDVQSLLAKCRIALSKEEGRKKIYYKKLKSAKKTLVDFKENHESVIENKNSLEKDLFEVKNEMTSLQYQLKDQIERNSTNEMLIEKLQRQLNSSIDSTRLQDSLKKSNEELESKTKLIEEMKFNVAKTEDSFKNIENKNWALKKELESSKIEERDLNEKLKLSIASADNQVILQQELEALKKEKLELKNKEIEFKLALSTFENQSKATISNLEHKLSANENEKQSNFTKAMDGTKELSLKVEEVNTKFSQSFEDNQKLKEMVENISDTILAKLNSIAEETRSVSKQLSNQKEIFAKIDQETHSGIAKIDEKSEDLCQKITELSWKLDQIPLHDEEKELNHLSNLMTETREHFNETIIRIEDNLINIINEQGSFLQNLEIQVVSLTDKIISMKEDEERRVNLLISKTASGVEPLIERPFMEQMTLDAEMVQQKSIPINNQIHQIQQVVDTESVIALNSGIQSLGDKLESIFDAMKENEHRKTQPVVPNPSTLELELSKELKKLEKDNMEMINHHQLLQEKFSNQTGEIMKLQQELERIKASDSEKAKHNYEMTRQTLQTMTQQRDHLNYCLDKEKELNRKLMDESRTFVGEFNSLRNHLKDIQHNVTTSTQPFQSTELPNSAIKDKLNDLKYQVDFLQHKIDVDKELRKKNEDSHLNSLKMDVFALKNEQLSKLSVLESTLHNLQGNFQLQTPSRPPDYNEPLKVFTFYKDIISMFSDRSVTPNYSREMNFGNHRENLTDTKHKIMDDVINLRSSLQVNKCQSEKLFKENFAPNYVSYMTPGTSNTQSNSTPEKICNNLCSSPRPSSSKKKYEDFRRTDLKFSTPMNNYSTSLAEISLLENDKSYKDIAEIYSLKAQSRLDASLDSLQNQMDL